ncbi:hypothetical protein [Amycolatopsis magusensis]|uniref:hypothetical protein n=1 Tax=Amycolatopsis magusensis TaxID=882444 RepID=UPI0024A89A4C|nr:hypothetical protein [Amycolatopsis magusensis]MDI5981891.1 hypothetical protein [Amycolatopsis magusensis]
MDEAGEFDKAEYDSLRAELIFHQTNASAIFALNIAGMGVGVTAAAKLGSALLVLSVLSCVLWLRYSDHVMALFRIAAYLETVLRPRVTARVGEAVLGWESFLRTGFTAPGFPALPSRDSRMGILVASGAFLLPPPLLCVAFVVRQAPSVSGGSRVLLLAAVACAGLIWLYTISRGVQKVRWVRAVDARLSAGARSGARGSSRPSPGGASPS